MWYTRMWCDVVACHIQGPTSELAPRRSWSLLHIVDMAQGKSTVEGNSMIAFSLFALHLFLSRACVYSLSSYLFHQITLPSLYVL